MTTAPPVAPPATNAAPPALTQDDRMLAAAAHLSFLAGFWLIAPIAIYAIKRKESRFVAFYALQAALVQVLFGVGTVLFIIVSIVLLAAAGMTGRQELAALVALVPILGGLSGCGALLCVHAYAAFRAWQGQEFTIPVAGQIAAAIMRADEGAAKV